MANPKENKEEKPKAEEKTKAEEKPKGPEEKPAGTEAGSQAEPATDPAAYMGALAEVMAELASLREAVTALANTGAVNESVATDNGEEDYPEIDLDEINRMMGA